MAANYYTAKQVAEIAAYNAELRAKNDKLEAAIKPFMKAVEAVYEDCDAYEIDGVWVVLEDAEDIETAIAHHADRLTAWKMAAKTVKAVKA